MATWVQRWQPWSPVTMGRIVAPIAPITRLLTTLHDHLVPGGRLAIADLDAAWRMTGRPPSAIRTTVKAIHFIAAALALQLLMAADCGPADAADEDDQSAPIPCSVPGTCRGSGGTGSGGGDAGGGGVDIIDDGLGDSDGLARPPFRGVYLNDLDQVLASARETDRLLLWLEANDFNSISCYDLGTIFDTAGASADLASFIARARREAGVVHVGAVHSDARSFSGPTLRYQTGRPTAAERFDAFHLEHEWWNGAGSFADTVRRLQTMTSVAHAQQPPLVTEEYLGWFQNPGDDDGNGVPDFTAPEMAAAIVRHSDRIMIHDYRRSPDFSYMESRLRLLSNAAADAGRDVDVVVIFSAETAAADGPDNDFMGRYFQTHTFDEAWTDLQAQIDDASPAATAHLNFIGYQVFASRQAMAARPL